MALSALISRIPPPSSPYGGAEICDWPALHHRLGVVLPNEFRRVIEVYGRGTFGKDSLQLHHPFYGPPSSRFEPMMRMICGAWDIDRQMNPEPNAHAIFPEDGGLLPFGTTPSEGNVLCWETSGEPENWPIFVRDIRGPGILSKVVDERA